MALLLIKARSKVVQTLLTEGSSASVAPVVYFYCKRVAAEPQRADPNEVLRALLKQICRYNKNVKEKAVREYEKRKEEAEIHGSKPAKLTGPECTELMTVFTKTSPATIIIDALDECERSRRNELLKALLDLQKSAKQLKVFISSRDEDNIVPKLEGVPNIYIRASDNEVDIARFVEQRVHMLIYDGELPSEVMSDRLKTWLITTLVNGAQGM